MKEVYQVMFTKQKKGNYLVEVPDLYCLTERNFVYIEPVKKYTSKEVKQIHNKNGLTQ